MNVSKDEDTGTWRQHNEKKENIVMVQEPGNNFISYVTPKTGGAVDTATAILTKLHHLNINLDKLTFIGGDGCPTNTGYKKGVIRQIEEQLERPLIWIICLLHLLELPLKKIFECLFEKGKGPNDFGPELGDKLEHCHEFPVKNFKKVNVKFPKMNLEDLSTDQKYLFMLAVGIKDGKISAKLSKYKPGPLNHARWLTFAARVLRYYVSIENPSKNLLILVTYIMKVYVPMWQAIKTENNVSKGSIHFLEIIKSTR